MDTFDNSFFGFDNENDELNDEQSNFYNVCLNINRIFNFILISNLSLKIKARFFS